MQKYYIEFVGEKEGILISFGSWQEAKADAENPRNWRDGKPRVISDDLTFIYHNSVMVNRMYKTESEAMAGSYGKYSSKPVIMPDGTETTPACYFDTEDESDVFLSWYDVKSELWPGETA